MKQRQTLAQHYFSCFKKTRLVEQGLELPLEDFIHSNWHMFQVVLPIEKLYQFGMNRATVMQKLKDMITDKTPEPTRLQLLFREILQSFKICQ